MKTTLRRIGNSRGVLLPAAFLAACEIENEIEIRLDDKRIVIEPLRSPRAGWFDRYNPAADEDVWPDFGEDEVETDEWQW